MPKYKIGRSYGFAGDEDFEVIEAKNEEEANKIAWDWAIERVDTWAEEITDEDES